MEDKDKFPRVPKNTFGDQTGWLYAGALVATIHLYTKAVDSYIRAVESETHDIASPYLELKKAREKMQDTIDATMEAAYAPTSPACETPPKDESWQQP